MAGTVASEIEDKDAGRGGTTTGCYIVTALIFLSMYVDFVLEQVPLL